nr:WecB/TagA/CpsF family glycosyltransferase [Rhodococcus corynebacterioides]
MSIEHAHDGQSQSNVAVVARVNFQITDLASAVGEVLTLARERTPKAVRLSNAYCVALAQQRTEYRDVLNGPGLTLPDGSPVVWFMNAGTGRRDSSRVRGPSLFTHSLDRGRQFGVSHFFVGTTDGTLNRLVAESRARFPGIRIAGTFSPPFGAVDDKVVEETAARVKASNADIVWVALGTPKQDFFTAALVDAVGRPAVGVGAAFDFLAGTAREAPTWMQNWHLEWFFRFVSEPRRLWRRYLIGNVHFLWAAYLYAKRSAR